MTNRKLDYLEAEEEFSRCIHCGAIYLGDLNDIDEPDHASDCPNNSYGYNNPRGLEVLMRPSDMEG